MIVDFPSSNDLDVKNCLNNNCISSMVIVESENNTTNTSPCRIDIEDNTYLQKSLILFKMLRVDNLVPIITSSNSKTENLDKVFRSSLLLSKSC